MNIVICTEGFQLKDSYILKELTILSMGEEWKHFFFLPPAIKLSTNDKAWIRHSTRYCHELSWSDGDIPYTLIQPILEKFKDLTIYSYGQYDTNLLEEFLPTSVIVNIQREGYTLPNSIKKRNCFNNHNPSRCALAKAHAVKEYMLNNLEGI